MRPLISTHRGHDRYDRRQHDTCTQDEIDDHTGRDAHVTTPRCSMIEHASANCRHAASAIQYSRLKSSSQRRLQAPHIGMPAPLHGIECTCKQTPRPCATARQRDSARTRQRSDDMHTCIWLRPPCPSMHCAAMLIGPKPANDATSSCQVKHTIQSWRVGIMAGSCHDAVAST